MTSTVISLTTLPSRLAYLERCVASLVVQGLPVYVWLPRYVERLDVGFDGVPEFLKEMSVHVEIVEDQGPATKLLPALKRFDTVITADDDHIYGEGWAQGFLEWAERRPDAALGYRGRQFGSDLRYNKSRLIERSEKLVEVHLITSVHGTLYHRRHFEASIFDEWKQWKRNDDIVLGGHLWQRGVPILVIPAQCSIRKAGAHATDALWHMNQQGANDKGLRKFYPGWGE